MPDRYARRRLPDLAHDGRFVRKGEKGIAIMVPIIGRRDAEPDGTSARAVVGFRAAYVFDVEQTDGAPLPEPCEASGDPGVKTAALRASIVERGIAIESVDDLDGALGTSSGRIRLLNGLSPATEFTTLVHEYAHLCTASGYVRFPRVDLPPGPLTSLDHHT